MRRFRAEDWHRHGSQIRHLWVTQFNVRTLADQPWDFPGLLRHFPGFLSYVLGPLALLQKLQAHLKQHNAGFFYKFLSFRGTLSLNGF